MEYAAELEVTRSAAGALDVFATLSTAASSEVDKETTTKIGISSGTSMRGSVSHCGYLLDLAAKADQANDSIYFLFKIKIFIFS